MKIQLEPIVIDINEIINQCNKEGEVVIKLDEQCQLLWEKAKKDPEFFLKNKKQRRTKYPRIPLEFLDSEEDYGKFIKSDLETPMFCPWNMIIRIESYESDNGWRFIVSFSNSSSIIKDPIIENSIFEASVNISLQDEIFKKFKLDYLEENYRHDRLIEASGINCSYISNSPKDIETVHTPIFCEKRIIPVESGADLSVCDFCMGHVVDALGYDKIYTLSPDYAVKQFKQTESHLSISKIPIPSDKAVPRREYETRLKEQQDQITQLQEQLKERRKGPEFIDLKVDVWDKVSTAIKLVGISSQSEMDILLNKIEAKLKKPT